MNRKRKNNVARTLTVIGIFLMVAIMAILIVNAVRNDKNADQAIPGSSAPNIGTSDDGSVTPYGDEASDDYDFTGDYYDTATGNGTMTITKDGKAYNINVTFSETDDSMSIWTMTAAYDKKLRALVFRDCSRIDYEVTDEASRSTNAYSGGTGMVYMTGDYFLWADDKEDMGAGLLFQRVEKIREAQEAEAASEGTDDAGASGDTGDEAASEDAEGAAEATDTTEATEATQAEETTSEATEATQPAGTTSEATETTSESTESTETVQPAGTTEEASEGAVE